MRIAHSRCAFVSHHEIVCVCCSVHGEGHCVYGVCMVRSTGSVESVSLNVYAIYLNMNTFCGRGLHCCLATSRLL